MSTWCDFDSIHSTILRRKIKLLFVRWINKWPYKRRASLSTTSTALRTVTFHTPLKKNITFDLEHGALERDFCIPLSIKTQLLTSSMGLWTVTFSYTSQSKCYFLFRAWGSGPWIFHTPLNQSATFTSSTGLRTLTFSYPSQSKHNFLPRAQGSAPWLFHIPLNQNATFDLEHGAPDRDFSCPSPSKRYFWTSSMGLQTITFHTPLNQNATFDLEHRAPDHDFFISQCKATHDRRSSQSLSTELAVYLRKLAKRKQFAPEVLPRCDWSYHISLLLIRGWILAW